VIASGVGLVFVLLFASLRLYTRYPFRSRLLYDDLVVIVSTASAIVQGALVIAAGSQGLGKSTEILQPGTKDLTEKVMHLRAARESLTRG
jgi:predicted ATP-dependent serine protease